MQPLLNVRNIVGVSYASENPDIILDALRVTALCTPKVLGWMECVGLMLRRASPDLANNMKYYILFVGILVSAV